MKKIGYNFDHIWQYRWLLKKHMLTPLSEYAQKYTNGRLLDIGCGDKPYQSLFPSKISINMGLDTNRIPTKADIYGSVTALPIKSNSINTVLCVWVLDDVPEPNHIFVEVSRVLKKGGKFLLVANQSDGLHFEPNCFYLFTKYAIKHLAEKNSMQILEYKEIGGVWIMIGRKFITYFSKICSKLFILKLLKPLILSVLNAVFWSLDKLHSPKYDIIGNVYVIKKNS